MTIDKLGSAVLLLCWNALASATTPTSTISTTSSSSSSISLFSRQLITNPEATEFSGDPISVTFWSTPNSLSLDSRFRLVEALTMRFKENPDVLQFSPQEYIVDGSSIGCRNDDSGEPLSEECRTRCMNHGRYCALGDTVQTVGVTGAQVVKESARRMCYWNVFGPESTERYLVYLEHLHFKKCDKNLTDTCVINAIKGLHVPVIKVQKCLHDAGPLGPDVDEENPLLEEALQASKALSDSKTPLQFPLLQVDGPNGSTLDPDFDPMNSFRSTVCGAFSQGEQAEQPLVCGFCGDYCPSGGNDGKIEEIDITKCVLRLECDDKLDFDEWILDDGISGEVTPSEQQSSSNDNDAATSSSGETKTSKGSDNNVWEELDFMAIGLILGASSGVLAALYFCIRAWRNQRRINEYLREQQELGMAHPDESEGSFLWPEDFDLDLEPAMQYSDYIGELTSTSEPTPSRLSSGQAPSKSMFLPHLT